MNLRGFFSGEKVKMIKIEREFRTGQNGSSEVTRESVVVLPKRSGVYDTGASGIGEIEVLVCPLDALGKVQKFVFTGKIMETSCKGGTTFRRVVKLPLSGKEVPQDISPTEGLVLSLEEK